MTQDREPAVLLRLLLRGQAIYYVVTGLWPLLSMATFERVTGPKVDDWLVHMVGLLAATIGVVLWAGALARRVAGTTVLLGALGALGFAAIDLRYALAGRISGVYLLDAAAELAISVALLVAWRVSRGSPTRGGADRSR